MRLFRGRRRDPAFTSLAPEFIPYIGYDNPSLCPNDKEEEAEFDLPDYDLRRLITARDPLSCVCAFDVISRVVLPSMFGFRMCPQRPHCALSKNPCMDRFGSNATPMGGFAGRPDAMVGAKEAQKAEGCLHLHFFVFMQMASQFCTLHAIAEMLRKRALSVEALKTYVSHVRCAAYPDPAKFEAERSAVEEAWPAYAEDPSLSRLPIFFGKH